MVAAHIALGLAGATLATAAGAATCFGNCGTLIGASGDVVAPPNGGTYTWVSTRQGQLGVGGLDGFSAVRGSELWSDQFFAKAGARLSFDANYITTDALLATSPTRLPDYASVQLMQFKDVRFGDFVVPIATPVETLYTARSLGTGSVIGAPSLPAVAATLSPTALPITPGKPVFEPLGPRADGSGRCRAADVSLGCGYTGWASASYDIVQEGTYFVRFGVTNANDQAFESALAFSGLRLSGAPVGDGLTPATPLLPTTIAADTGRFTFVFKATPGLIVFVDPPVSIGFTYQVQSGPLIRSAIFPTVSGDSDGYAVHALGSHALLFDHVMPGTTVDFTSLAGFGAGIGGFTLEGIAPGAMLDPGNSTAFVTGFDFMRAGDVKVSMTPITLDLPAVPSVPESGAAALMLFGLAGLGALRRVAPAVSRAGAQRRVPAARRG